MPAPFSVKITDLILPSVDRKSEAYKSTHRSIRLEGAVKEPVKITPGPNSTWNVVEGADRAQVAFDLGFDFIPSVEVASVKPTPRRREDDPRYQTVPTAAIRTDHNFCEIPLDEELVEKYAVDIADRGLQTPIGVFWDDGALFLAYGRHRLSACRHLGMETIPAFVIDKDRARLASIEENLERVTLSPEQRKRLIRVQAEERVRLKLATPARQTKSEDEILRDASITNLEAARLLGINEKTVRRRRAKIEGADNSAERRESRPMGRPKGGVKEMARQMGVPETTLRRAAGDIVEAVKEKVPEPAPAPAPEPIVVTTPAPPPFRARPVIEELRAAEAEEAASVVNMPDVNDLRQWARDRGLSDDLLRSLCRRVIEPRTSAYGTDTLSRMQATLTIAGYDPADIDRLTMRPVNTHQERAA